MNDIFRESMLRSLEEIGRHFESKSCLDPQLEAPQSLRSQYISLSPQ